MIVLDDSLVHLAGIFHNMYLKLEESEDNHYLNDDGWKFHIHDANEVPILAVTTHGTSLYPGQGRDLRLDMKKVKKILDFYNIYTHIRGALSMSSIDLIKPINFQMSL